MKISQTEIFLIGERDFFMKIVDFESYKKYVDKLDSMAQTDMTKPDLVFRFDKKDESVAEKMQKFFDVADGNGWKV